MLLRTVDRIAPLGSTDCDCICALGKAKKPAEEIFPGFALGWQRNRGWPSMTD